MGDDDRSSKLSYLPYIVIISSIYFYACSYIYCDLYFSAISFPYISFNIPYIFYINAAFNIFSSFLLLLILSFLGILIIEDIEMTSFTDIQVKRDLPSFFILIIAALVISTYLIYMTNFNLQILDGLIKNNIIKLIILLIFIVTLIYLLSLGLSEMAGDGNEPMTRYGKFLIFLLIFLILAGLQGYVDSNNLIEGRSGNYEVTFNYDGPEDCLGNKTFILVMKHEGSYYFVEKCRPAPKKSTLFVLPDHRIKEAIITEIS